MSVSLPRRIVGSIARAMPVLGAIIKERNALRTKLIELGETKTSERHWRYTAIRYLWQTYALRRELYGPPASTPLPPKEIPPEMMAAFTMNGRAAISHHWLDGTCPANHPLIYTDGEIDDYIGMIRARSWFIYGTLDGDVCAAMEKYPIAGKSVVNMGSLTPWYEAMCIHYGGFPTTIDYNRIVLGTTRMRFMTIAEWERERPRFDVGLSISSFEHDGLGMYGDPLDPDGDLKAMRKMKERIKPGGLLFLAVPTGRDRVVFNTARIYGRIRLPLLMEGWNWIDSFEFEERFYDDDGTSQPLYVLRNPG